LKSALGDGDRAALATDARVRSAPDAGLTALYGLAPSGSAHTAVSDAVLASAPAGHQAPRVFGPDSKGLNSAWDRKEMFVLRLCGAADEPGSLVLTSKDRKPLVAPDSRYQKLPARDLRPHRPVLRLRPRRPDFIELLEDVGRGFSGHVPPNMALVPRQHRPVHRAAHLDALRHHARGIPARAVAG